MQEIWARILSGEINHPGSFSLRAIEILKNLGQKDAELFGKICSFAIRSSEHIFVPFYESYLDMCGITYSEIMRLDELGLINSTLLFAFMEKNTKTSGRLKWQIIFDMVRMTIKR